MPEQLDFDFGEGSEPHRLWRSALELAGSQLGADAIDGWLADVQPRELTGDTLKLSAPNATARIWIERRYAGALKLALTEVRGRPTTVDVVVEKRPVTRSVPKPTTPRESAVPAPPPLFAPLPLHPKFTFDNFVLGRSNRFAQAAARAVADKPGQEFNPLFIHGQVGIGKTHLLHAIGHAVRFKNPRLRIAYVSGETFTSHFITSLREHKAEDFRRAYRSVDVWLVDDIQFIAGRTGTREEFFHTFNELHLTNRQVVLAADRPPRDLPQLEDRLRTRLEAGLTVQVLPPELETRVGILQRRAAWEGVEIDEQVLFEVARAVTSDARTLEAALVRTLAMASLGNTPVTPEVAREALAAFTDPGRAGPVLASAILRVVADHFEITLDELTGPRREAPISRARQTAMYLLREFAGKSLAEIGEMFGGKSHSTVLYSLAKVRKELQADGALATLLRTLETRARD